METDLSFFPEELHSVYSSSSTTQVKAASKAKKAVSIKDTLSQLEEIASKEEDKQEKDAEDEEEEADEEEAYEEEEEEFEDETDYNFSYFDNGEDYGDYDDGNDEAVFWINSTLEIHIW